MLNILKRKLEEIKIKEKAEYLNSQNYKEIIQCSVCNRQYISEYFWKTKYIYIADDALHLSCNHCNSWKLVEEFIKKKLGCIQNEIFLNNLEEDSTK